MIKILAGYVLFPMLLMSTFSWSDVNVTSVTDQRIIGGEQSSEPYEWVVSIQRGSHFCGGVLVSKDFVLTAAHCLEGKTASSLTLKIGFNDLSQSLAGDTRQADWFLLHPDYNDQFFYSDLALIKLDQSSTKTPINVVNRDAVLALQQNEQLRVLGWGVTDSGSTSSTLREVDVSFQRDDICNSTYPNNSIEGYWDRSLCAGEVNGGKDSCQGDSGGPMLVKANNQWALMGLVSWGSGCAEAGLYGVYTEVSAMIDWIEQRHNGVTLLGEEKIGFIGQGRQKAQAYTVSNLSDQAQSVGRKSVDNGYFEIDEANWLLGDSIPAGHACEFSVNGQGDVAGEHFAQMTLELDEYDVTQNLNSKVLDSVPAEALDTQWPFFSGNAGFSEHSASWFEQTDAEQGTVMQSGNASLDGRSVLLTYLNGPVGDENQYLKFESQVNNGGSNYLAVYINEQTPLLVISENWSTYTVALQPGINHVMFIYMQSQGLFGHARLNNVRVCSDQVAESTCSSASGFYNNDDLALQDDPAPSTDWQSVCSALNSSAITYSGRSASDAVFNTEEERISGSKVSGAISEVSKSGGPLSVWFMVLLALLLPLYKMRLCFCKTL